MPLASFTVTAVLGWELADNAVIKKDSQLSIPMYYFLLNLLLIDIVYS